MEGVGLVRVWREWDWLGCGGKVGLVRVWRESGTGEAVEGKWDW